LANHTDFVSGHFLAKKTYGWMPHNAGFGFLDKARAKLGKIHF
jgi:hypothetical protein